MVSKIKQIALMILVVVMGMGSKAEAQLSDVKVIALLNKASWCHVCEEHTARVQKDIMPMVMKNKNVQVVVNNVTDDKSKAASKPMLEKAGITEVAKKYKGTGVIYFLDAKSKKLLSKVSISESNEDIKGAFSKALSSL